MLILISPSKTMDFNELCPSRKKEFILDSYSHILRDYLIGLSDEDLKTLYKSSDNIIEQAKDFNQTSTRFKAIELFNGAVFKNLDYPNLNPEQRTFIDKHVLIFSGLYGIVPAGEAIIPYRFDLNNSIDKSMKKPVSVFKPKVTNLLLSKKDHLVIDLASKEYKALIDYNTLGHSKEIISIEFKDFRNGTYKSLGTYAKMARGQFLQKVSSLPIKSSDDLKSLSVMDYRYNLELSTETEYTYTR